MLVFINEKVNRQSFNVIKKIWGKIRNLRVLCPKKGQRHPDAKKETSSLPSGRLLLDNMN